MSRRILNGLVMILALNLSLLSFSHAAEDWKGPSDSNSFSVGVLAGLGLVDSSPGASLLGSISRKILEPGFAPDINNGVSAEFQFGPVLVSGGTPLFYSAHLRWDFRKNPDWTLYAIGGLAGFTAATATRNPFEFFPRFGIGSLWKVQERFAVRAELSHELLAMGILFPF